jgi:predicted nuclease of predicted toxin-antitoxin system
MKVLVDMNLSPRWVDCLIASEIHAAHWSSIGEANALDTEIMAFAAQYD